jgi:hypothetical protein
MSRIEPKLEYKAIVDDTGGHLRLTFPPKVHQFSLVFFMVWIVVWTYAGMINIGQFLRDPNLFTVFWLAGWLAGEVFVLYVILWSFVGVEQVYVNQNSLTHSRTVFGKGLVREYDLGSVKKIRPSPLLAMPFGIGANGVFWGIAGGSIVFDYGMKSVSVGIGIESPEADFLVGKLDTVISRRNQAPD